jgi:DNA polymerase III epsilon subunit-like protein
VVVAHNIAFDRSMIRAEIIRNGSRLQQNIPYIDCLFHPAYDGCLQVEHYDTMIRTAKLCQLYMHTTTGKLKLKMPKLVELYQVLFHQTPIHMHNSMVDTLVCMRCFLKIRHQLDIDDDVFEKMLAKYGSKIINKWVKPPTIVTRQL